MSITFLEKWTNTIYVNTNVCYNLPEYCTDCEYIVKIGSTKCLPARYYNYITYTPRKTNILAFYHIIDYDCYKLDNDIKHKFNKYRIKDDGGIEYYKNTILIELETYFTTNNIKFIKYNDITDFPVLNTATTTLLSKEARNDEDNRTDIINKIAIKKREKKNVIIDNKINSFKLENELNDHQIQILNNTIVHFNDNSTGILNLFCRYGKTRLSSIFCMLQKYKTILVLVPSLYLVEQTYNTWKTYFNTNLVKISSQSRDSTDIDKIKKLHCEFLQSKETCIFITTYHSSYKFKDLHFEICIYDEAHRTTGDITNFNILVKSDKIINKLFLTATLKYYDYAENDYTDLKINSMDDNQIYGKIISVVSAKQALELKRICPYYILTMKLKAIEDITELDNVSNDFINSLQKSINNDVIIDFLKDNRHRYIRIAYGLLETILEKNIKHILTFHRYRKGCELFKLILDTFIKLQSKKHDKNYINKKYKKIKTNMIDGDIAKSKRDKILKDFQDDNNFTILCSAKVLQEGVDIPKCDSTCFVDLKTSSIDTVQSLARCMTYLENKKAYIIIPFDEKDFETSNDDTTQDTITDNTIIKKQSYAMDFRILLRNIIEIDDNIKSYFRRYLLLNTEHTGNISNDNSIEFAPNCAKCLIDANVVLNIGDIAYEVFSVAKAKIKALYVNEKEYKAHIEIDFEGNIPVNPDKIYRSLGWHGWNDYLGIDPFMPIGCIRTHMHNVNKLLCEENKPMIETKKEYETYAKANNMMVQVVPKNNNWCWLLLPNYDDLLEKYYKVKEDIMMAIKKLNIKTIEEYEQKHNSDDKLPPYKYLANGFYNDNIPIITKNISQFISSLYDDPEDIIF
jgi:superfamily II DNA or RNA helicase